MPSRSFPGIKKGQLARVIATGYPYVSPGDIVRFVCVNTSNTFTFSTLEGTRLTFKSDNDFEMLSPKDSIKDIIDIALDTKDKEWFNSLVHKLERESIDK